MPCVVGVCAGARRVLALLRAGPVLHLLHRYGVLPAPARDRHHHPQDLLDGVLCVPPPGCFPRPASAGLRGARGCGERGVVCLGQGSPLRPTRSRPPCSLCADNSLNQMQWAGCITVFAAIIGEMVLKQFGPKKKAKAH